MYICNFLSVNEWDNSSKGSKLFNNAVQGIWEGSSWSSRSVTYTPRTTLMVNANATPDDIKYEPGVKSKVISAQIWVVGFTN